MSIDTEITARLAKIATTLESLAGIEADPALKRDTTITARLKRINDSIQGGALEAHTLTSHPDVNSPSPNDGDFFRYSAAISAWINDTMALSDATDVTATPVSGNYLRGNGTIWSNSSILLADLPVISLDNLNDIDLDSPAGAGIPARGHVLQYDWNGIGEDWSNNFLHPYWLQVTWDGGFSLGMKGRIQSTAISGTRPRRFFEVQDTIGTLEDVDVTGEVTGSVLRWSGITNWEAYLLTLDDLDGVVIAAPADDEFLRYDGSDWVNEAVSLVVALDDLSDVTIAGLADKDVLIYDSGGGAVFKNEPKETLIRADGTIPLTGDWDAGAFEVEALTLLATYDVNDIEADALSAVMAVEDTSSGGSRVYRGLFIDLDYDYNNGGGLDTNRVKGLELDVDVTTSAFIFSACKPQCIRAVITNDADTPFGTSIPDVPFSYLVENNKTNQNFADGAFNFQLNGGATSGNCVSTQSLSLNAGSGDIIAYLGYAKAVSGFSGDAIGLKAFISGLNTAASLIGVSSLPKALGTFPANDKIMAYHGDNGHWLASRASLFVTSTQRATPNAFATTHLTRTNLEGAGYFEGLLEIDGTLYADAAVEIVGDAKFTTAGGGWPFGEIYEKDNTNTMSVSSAAFTQVLDFAFDGQSNQCTPDHTNDHITIDIAGIYLITCSISAESTAGLGHAVDFCVGKNNGGTLFNNVHAHRDLAGGGGDKGSISLSGIVSLSAADTIELWATTDSVPALDIIVGDCTLSVVQIGA